MYKAVNGTIKQKFLLLFLHYVISFLLLQRRHRVKWRSCSGNGSRWFDGQREPTGLVSHLLPLPLNNRCRQNAKVSFSLDTSIFIEAVKSLYGMSQIWICLSLQVSGIRFIPPCSSKDVQPLKFQHLVHTDRSSLVIGSSNKCFMYVTSCWCAK